MHRDSSSTTTTHLPLDYLQASPVRGQLEPQDEVTRKSGWRFLQCTDTPNELKVLLPPRTAHIYALLFKAELAELAKQQDASWERILDIRRLKDRMIRKCQRLAKTYSANNSGAHIPFLTLHAPPDFRLKEMEKWIRRHEGSDALKNMVPNDTLRPRGSFCCDRCANLVPHHHTVSSRRSSMQPKHSVHSRRSSMSERLSPKASPTSSRRPCVSPDNPIHDSPKPSPPGSSIILNESITRKIRAQETRVQERTTMRESDQLEESISSRSAHIAQERTQVRAPKHQRSMSIDATRFVMESKSQKETKRTIHTILEDPHELSTDRSNRSVVESHHEVESLGCLSVASPDPIPVPYHGSTSAAFMDICHSPVDMTRDEARHKFRWRESSGEDTTPSPPSEDEPTADGMPRPDMPRRRSSLKRNNSDLQMSLAYSTKTVSWAMDRDWVHQMTKYHTAAAQVEHAGELSSYICFFPSDARIGEEWGVMCEKYKEELASLKVLRRNVTQTLSKLRLETEKLQREDEVIRDQEGRVRLGYEQLEHKHGQYQAKVKAVLQETEQVLTLCGTKRDDELHGL
ncbi:hypothetical protein BDN67DRAFT_961056 [Paxillus ammoniavirescens]|nr:hypothetical protein BDN67DRAFT_961056 [Paxillus ammoniavirescens]